MRIGGCISGANIPGVVNLYFSSQRLHPLGNFAMAITHGWGEKCPSGAPRLLGETGKFAAPLNRRLGSGLDLLDIGQHSGHELFAAFLTAKPSLDGAVRLIDGHEDFVRIILP